MSKIFFALIFVCVVESLQVVVISTEAQRNGEIYCQKISSLRVTKQFYLAITAIVVRLLRLLKKPARNDDPLIGTLKYMKKKWGFHYCRIPII